MTVLIPNQLSVTPRGLDSVENNYMQFVSTPPNKLAISVEGKEWLEWRSQGLTPAQVLERANVYPQMQHNGSTRLIPYTRYRLGAVELFYKLADSMNQQQPNNNREET